MFAEGWACAGPRGNPAIWKICSDYSNAFTNHMDGWSGNSGQRTWEGAGETQENQQSPHWPLSEVISDGRFVEALALAEELSDVVAGVFQQVILNEELDPLRQTQGPRLHTANENRRQITFLKNHNIPSTYLLRVHVEFLPAHGHLFIPLHIFPGTSDSRLSVSLDTIMQGYM